MNAAQLAGGGIKSLQRGTISLAAGLGSGTATVTAVDTTKSELRFLGCSVQAAVDSIRIVLTNSTTIAANSGASNTGTSVVSWELTERY